MYSVIWKENTCRCSKLILGWEAALDFYAGLLTNPRISDLYIYDNEYGVEFRDGRWEQREDIVGWAGSV